MDDNISDEINVVSSDDGDPIREVVIEDDEVEVVTVDGGRGSPGSDEVVVVDHDEGVVDLVEETDDDETSEDDEQGQEEDDVAAASEGNPLQPSSQSSASAQQSQPATGENTPQHQQQGSVIRTEPVSSTSTENEASGSTSNFPSTSLPGPSTSENRLEPGPSSSQNQNTSVGNFQVPVLHRAGVSAALAAASSNESFIEFRSPKRRRLISPAKNSSKVQQDADADDAEDEDDGNSCSICFEPWDNSGRHRLASLKCGHLFGLGCIEKWLKGQGGKCPSCNKKAKMKDIRVIYAKAIKMVDTTERDRALQELEKEKELRRQAELEAAQARLHCQQYVEQSQKLTEEMKRLQGELSSVRSQTGGGLPLSQASRSQSSHSRQLQGQFLHDKTIKIWDGGQCRVLAHCPSMAVLVISQPSANHLFPGFGIKKLSCMDFKTSSYLTLHQKAVRGVSFHQTVDDGLLLSVSMDKTVKLTSIITNNVVQTYRVNAPLWSCEWNAENQNYFYVGQQNGLVLEFDTRNTAEHVRELNAEGSKSPVVALQYLSRNVNAAFRPGGLIVGQLDKVSFFENKTETDSRLHLLPLEGNLTSLNVDIGTRHLLASFRPSAKHPSVRHQLCELTCTNTLGNAVVSCNGVHTFHGGRSQSVLGKTMLVSHPADESRLLVVAGDEPSESTHLWDSGTSQLMQRLPCQGVPVDFSTFVYNDNTYLAALTDKCLKLHRWN